MTAWHVVSEFSRTRHPTHLELFPRSIVEPQPGNGLKVPLFLPTGGPAWADSGASDVFALSLPKVGSAASLGITSIDLQPGATKTVAEEQIFVHGFARESFAHGEPEVRRGRVSSRPFDFEEDYCVFLADVEVEKRMSGAPVFLTIGADSALIGLVSAGFADGVAQIARRDEIQRTVDRAITRQPQPASRDRH